MPKIDFVLIGNTKYFLKINDVELTIGDVSLKPSACDRNLGMYLILLGKRVILPRRMLLRLLSIFALYLPLGITYLESLRVCVLL